jgi:hypothetical protein
VIKVFGFKPVIPTCSRLESRYGHLIISCEKAIQLTERRCSTQIPVRAWKWCTEGHPRSSFSSKAGKSPYDLVTVLVRRIPTKNLIKCTSVLHIPLPEMQNIFVYDIKWTRNTNWFSLWTHWSFNTLKYNKNANVIFMHFTVLFANEYIRQ